MASELEKLQRKRATIRGIVTKSVNKIAELIESDCNDVLKLEEQLESLQEKAEQLCQLDEQVEAKIEDLDELESEVEKCQEYREIILSIKFKLNKHLKGKLKLENNKTLTEHNSAHEDSTLVIPEKKCTVRLPKLSLEPFDGNIEKFQEFWSQFESSIHNNDILTNVDKFLYLKSFLKEAALVSLEGILVSEDNYMLAIDILKDRYGRRDVIVRTHINNLLNLTPVRSTANLKELRELYDNCQVQIRSLKTLDIDLNSYGNLLFPLLIKLIPDSIVLEFNRKSAKGQAWDVSELLKFLKLEIENRETTFLCCKNSEEASKFRSNVYSGEKYRIQNQSKFNFRPNDKYLRPNDRHFRDKRFQNEKQKGSASSLTAITKDGCLFCKSGLHESDKCDLMTVDQKREVLLKQGRCFLCLEKWHRVSSCEKKTWCDFCQRKHNKAICYRHFNQKLNANDRNKLIPIPTNDQNKVTTVSHCKAVTEIRSKVNNVLLQTCLVEVGNKFHSENIRCIMDGGSQRSFLKKEVARKLKLPVVRKEKLSVYTFGAETPIERNYNVVRVKIRNIEDPNRNIEIEALESENISTAYVPVPDLSFRNIKSLKGLQLADCYENKSQTEICMLIGADYYWDIVTGKIKRLSSKLVATETVFGWTVQGQYDNSIIDERIAMNLVIHENTISDQLNKFWELENLGVEAVEAESVNPFDQEVMHDFKTTIKYENNRYKVKLPWKPDMKCRLEDNYEIANERHKRLKVKFRNNPLLFEQYKEVINDYLHEHIVERIPLECDSRIERPIFYLPHRAVIREDKTTSTLRVVFDGSSHGKDKISLNDCLYTGPNLNPDILDLLVRFREYPIAFTADIKQAFLQIELDDIDRDVARFFWSDNLCDQDVPKVSEVLRFTRVLFGVKSSPFLLAATIRYHLERYKEKYPETCKLLNESLYVDDFIGGHSDVDQAFSASLESIDIFKEAGMHLRKFQTNSKELRERWNEAGVNGTNCSEVMTQTILPFKVLGIAWNHEIDTLYFDTQSLKKFLSKRCDTKRFVLQVAGRIFDPIGFLGPFTIKIKCLIQEMWVAGLGWDDELPEQLKTKWYDWCDEVTELNKVAIPRYYLEEAKYEKIKEVELHCFSDASKKAYGAVLYFRIITDCGNIHTSFVSAKSRVAPLKTISLPRLELMGALLSARLSSRIVKGSKYNITCHFWTDSTITFYWIRGIPGRFKPFVKNRIEEIQKLTEPSNWSHCSGKENPADMLSRGATVTDLKNSKLWWHGPCWLQQSSENWPAAEQCTVEEANLELRSKLKGTVQYKCTLEKRENLMESATYSSLFKMLRVTAWIKRFISNSRRSVKIKGPLTVEELQEAEAFWIKQTQLEFYNSDIQSLKKNGNVDKQSSLYSLSPYLDEKEVLRIGGRLDHADFTVDEKHPIILPRNSKFTELLIQAEHHKIMHCGVAATLTRIRTRFWIPKGRQLVKKIIRRCLVCRRYSAKPANQITAPLPRDRIQETPPFYVCGIDFAGPIYVNGDTGTEKSYIALFTCAVTRAIHLELVSDMTTQKFLLAFRRFVSRRGVCHTIYSDNAKTFKCAEKEFKHIAKILQDQRVQDFVAKEGIKWKYIIERAAWWGGFYERMVKSVKECLKKILGKALLNFEELTTLLTEIESVLNLRPLTYVYSDALEPQPLTPAHFLNVGRSSYSYSFDPNTLIKASNKTNLSKRKLYQTRLLKQIWLKWKQQYLMELRTAHRLANACQQKEMQVGDVVLVEGSAKSKFLWDLGVVNEVFRGRDGHVRSCVLRTAKVPALKRPVQLLYPLEIENSDNSDKYSDGHSTLRCPEDEEKCIRQQFKNHVTQLADVRMT